MDLSNVREPAPGRLVFKIVPYSLQFSSSEKFAEWLNAEKQYWNKFERFGRQYAEGVQEMFQLISSIRAPHNSGQLKDIKELLENRYIPSSAVSFMIDPMMGHGDEGDMLASAIVLNLVKPSEIRLNTSFSPAIAIAEVLRAYGSPRQLTKITSNARSGLEKAKATAEEIEAGYKAFLNRVQSEWVEKVEGYSAFAKLKAPKDYWEGKATHHKIAADKARMWWHSSLIAAGLMLLVILAYLSLTNYSPKLDADHAASLILHLAASATVVSFYTWWMKQLLRNVRSHEHLAEDAAERVTMIGTFSAMRALSNGDADLTPAFAAIYRPASTGLINDSGPVLPTEVVLNTVARKTGQGASG